MFKELLPLLEGRTVVITAAKTAEGSLTVTVCPARNGDKDEPPVAMTPLCISGSADELDHELPTLLAGYVEVIGGFRSNLAAIKAQVAEAAETNRLAQAAKTAKKTPAAPKAAAAPTAAPAPRADLFAASLPVAKGAAEEPAEGGTREMADGVTQMPAQPPADPRVVAPPAAAPRARRTTPIRGKAVEAAPVPDAAAAPAPPPVAVPLGLASEEEEEVAVAPVAAAAAPPAAPPAPIAPSAATDLGWADDDTAPEVVVDSGAPASDEDDDCPF